MSRFHSQRPSYSTEIILCTPPKMACLFLCNNVCRSYCSALYARLYRCSSTSTRWVQIFILVVSLMILIIIQRIVRWEPILSRGSDACFPLTKSEALHLDKPTVPEVGATGTCIVLYSGPAPWIEYLSSVVEQYPVRSSAVCGAPSERVRPPACRVPR